MTNQAYSEGPNGPRHREVRLDELLAEARAAGRAEVLAQVAEVLRRTALQDHPCEECEALRALVAGQPVEPMVRVADVRALVEKQDESHWCYGPCDCEPCVALRRLCGLEVG